MNTRLMMSSCAVAVFTAGTAVIAQQTPPRQPQSATANRVQFVGCVQSRAAYLQSQATAGSRVGNTVAAGNDFVLIQASPSTTANFSVEPGGTIGVSAGAATAGAATQGGTSAGVTVQAQPGATTQASVGTSGAASAYALTGHAAELRTHMGKRVEIVGTIARSNANTNAGANANANASANTDLQAMTVISVREVTGDCAGK
jgi:hypothetical protein